LKGFCFNLFVGGLDTVSTNMPNQFRHLAENPEHQDDLRANPDKITDAIEEMMRAYAAVTTLRFCKLDTEISSVQMKAGDMVLLPTFPAANDPEIFPNPELVDLNRNRAMSVSAMGRICASACIWRAAKCGLPWRKLCRSCRNSASSPRRGSNPIPPALSAPWSCRWYGMYNLHFGRNKRKRCGQLRPGGLSMGL
jgi:Cytochrome P450